MAVGSTASGSRVAMAVDESRALVARMAFPMNSSHTYVLTVHRGGGCRGGGCIVSAVVVWSPRWRCNQWVGAVKESPRWCRHYSFPRWRFRWSFFGVRAAFPGKSWQGHVLSIGNRAVFVSSPSSLFSVQSLSLTVVVVLFSRRRFCFRICCPRRGRPHSSSKSSYSSSSHPPSVSSSSSVSSSPSYSSASSSSPRSCSWS